MSEPRIVEAVDPDEAFAALADAKRIDILRALWDADDQELSFSGLREATGIRDSGQFNYHLGKLTGRFVEKTDGSYELRQAGIQVVGSLLAGAYTMAGDAEPIELGDPCPSCGSSLTFRYENEMVGIDCGECGFSADFPLPPGVFASYERDSLPTVASRYALSLVHRASNGFCPHCEGRSRPNVKPVAEADDDAPDRFQDVPIVHFDCDRCGETVSADLGTALLDEPAVVSFFHDRGIDIREVPIWRLSIIDRDGARIQSRDHLRAWVEYRADGSSLRVTVDESLEILDVEGPDE